MFKNVVTALAEARDITLYLSPLMKHFLQFEDTDFSESKPLLKPLMHVVCLVRLSLKSCLIMNFTNNFQLVVMGKLKLLSHICKINCSS